MEDRTDHTERHPVADNDGDDHQPATAGDEKSLDCPFRLFGVSRHHHSEVEQRGFLRAHDTHDPALEDHPLPAEHEILGGAEFRDQPFEKTVGGYETDAAIQHFA
ncbi:hypothetical protein QEZ47_00085 [Aminobacter anthyllidis]|uniref:hypothetical protein n=1 Tax=Aminobacter anthyllidis TaxID=1035067 RepID=UPI002454471A|nr:hypothetical protein [Aminobacter anthyllidis]MDH4983979.1 hypothetical protein [Aminobacter anthyllidis]